MHLSTIYVVLSRSNGTLAACVSAIAGSRNVSATTGHAGRFRKGGCKGFGDAATDDHVTVMLLMILVTQLLMIIGRRLWKYDAATDDHVTVVIMLAKTVICADDLVTVGQGASKEYVGAPHGCPQVSLVRGDGVGAGTRGIPGP